MEYNELRIVSNSGIVPCLLSNVIMCGDISYKTFRYIKTFKYNGTQTEKIYYTIVNFISESAFNKLDVDELDKDYELVLNATKTRIVTTDQVEIYQLNNVYERVKKVELPDSLKTSYFIHDELEFDINVNAFTCMIEHDKEIEANCEYFGYAFSSYIPLFSCCSYFDNRDNDDDNNESAHIFSIISPLSVNRCASILDYVINWILKKIDIYEWTSYMLDETTCLSSEFHYIRALVDAANIPSQHTLLIDSKIINTNGPVVADKTKLRNLLLEYKEKLKIINATNSD